MSDYKYFTRDEYLAAERVAESKSEYVVGEMIAMAGTSFVHARIVANLSLAIQLKLGDKPCQTVTNDVRVGVTPDVYVYPDILVACGDLIFHDDQKDTLLNPSVIIEVLSKSTENWDRGGKFEYYRQIDSLTDYILVSQNKYLVEHRSRQSEATCLLNVVEGSAGVVDLESIGCKLTVAEIYKGVDVDRGTATP